MDLSELSTNAHRHPWEVCRTEFLASVMGDHLKLNPEFTVLDVGAGDLFFSRFLHQRTSVAIDAVDHAFDDEEEQMIAIKKIKNLSTVLHKQYDAIFALDVLEHVEQDQEFLDLIISLLKPGGKFLITVPAYQRLFSFHDIKLRHYRRYRMKRLLNLIAGQNSIQIDEKFYFFHSLLYVRILEKFLQNFKKTDATDVAKGLKTINFWKYSQKHLVTRALQMVLNVDAKACRLLSKWGFRVPGLSAGMVLSKKSSAL